VLVAERVAAAPQKSGALGIPEGTMDDLLQSPLTLDGCYRVASFDSFLHLIDASRFYDPDYDSNLSAMIAHVLRQEAPIIETQLVQRIARAHGFRRAGPIIRDRIMSLARQRHYLASQHGAEPFAWLNASSAAAGIRARFPAGEDDIRQIEDICLAELGATGISDPVEIARMFGVRRLSSAARNRIEQALTLTEGIDPSAP
jgi:hypothetical protein